MTDAEIEADRKTLAELEIELVPVVDCKVKRASLEVINAVRLLLQATPDVDNAVEALGRATGHLFNHLGI